MSYELWINSPQEEILRKELLQEKMLSEGWEIRFLADDAFSGDRGVGLLPSVGPLDKHVLLAGWPIKQANSNLLAQLFSQGDAEQLEEVFMDEDAFSTCSLSVSNSDQDNVKTEYHFRLRGIGIVSGWELTHSVWEAIGTLSNGELVNPQQDGEE